MPNGTDIEVMRKWGEGVFFCADEKDFSAFSSKVFREVVKAAGFKDEDLPLRFQMIGEEEAAKQAYMAYPSGVYAFDLSSAK